MKRPRLAALQEHQAILPRIKHLFAILAELTTHLTERTEVILRLEAADPRSPGSPPVAVDLATFIDLASFTP